MRESKRLKRRDCLSLRATVPALMVWRCAPPAAAQAAGKAGEYDWNKHYWAYAVDTTQCIGCCACMRACRAENDVPAGVERTWVARSRGDGEGGVKVDAAKGPASPLDPGAAIVS